MSLQISCWLAAVCVVAHVVGMPQDTDNRAGLERPSTSAPPEVNECGLDSLISDVFGGNPNCNNGGNQPPTDGGYQPPPDGGYQPPPGSGGNQPPPDGGYQPPPGSGGNQPPPDGGYQPPTNGGDGCECVPFYQCSDNNTIIEDGYGLIDIRLKDECGAYDQKCCYPANINPIKPPPRPPVPTDNKCGTRHFDGVGVRITGAEDNEAQYGEFPWMVALVQPHPTKVQDGQPVFVYQCGGSLIHPQVVLTGAHCVRGKNNLVVRAGEWDTQTKNELYPTQDRNVRDVIIHEQFNNNTLVNDPALLILESPVDLSYENIGLVCLPEENENMDGRNCVASGWGKDQFGKEGKYQVILKKVELPIVPKQPCVEALRKTRLGPRFQLHSSFICAGGIPGKDTCKGDGGSPLACPSKTNPEVYVQAGIVAWGISCNTEAPGVYVNVPSFVSWIYNKLQQHGISLDDTCGNTNCKKSESDLVTGNNEPSTNSHGSNNEPSTNSHGSNIDQSNINGGSNYVSNSGNDGSSSYTNNNNPSSDNKPIKPDTNSNVGSYDVTAGNNNDGNHKPPSDSNNGFDPKNPTVNDNDSGAKPAENNGGVQNLPGQTDNSVYNPVPGEANNANSNDCTCVPFYLCNDNSSVSEDGVGLLDIRLKDECGAYDLKCCKITEVKSNNTLYISTTPSTGVPYKKKCGTYNKKGVGVHIIGTKDNEAQYGEFPWMVALVQPHPTKVQDGHPVFVYQCGGSLIHPQVVLTGAHCVKDKSNLVVRAGEWDTQTKNELYPTQDRNVRDVIIHEQFNNNTLVNDPALLILETPVDLSYENIGLVCLPEENENMDRRNCVASGWGKDQFGKKGKYQVILKKVDLPVVPRERCLELLRSTRLGSHFQLHSSLICAGGVPGKDTCQGDGGSPLACPSKTNPEVYVQAGIVGWGIGCNTEIPGVYVNVPAFVPWIHNKLQEHGITL